MLTAFYAKFLEFQSSSFLTDYQINCEDGVVQAHRLVLSIFMRSEAIERFFGSRDVDSSIFCPYKVENVQHFLEILYKGGVEDVLNPNDNTVSIMEYFSIDSSMIVSTNKSLLEDDELLSTNSIMNSDSDTFDDDDDIEAIVDNEEEEEEMNQLMKVYKRNPYRRYKEMPIDIKYIRFQLLNDFCHGSITRISTATGIPKTTLSRWRTKLIQDSNYSPVIPNYSKSKQSLDQIKENKKLKYRNFLFF